MRARPTISIALFALAFITLSASDASAQNDFRNETVTIDIVSGDSVSTPPGRVLTLIFRISNLLQSESEFRPGLSLPDNWRLAGTLSPVHVPGEGSTVRFVTYRIPESAKAGVYPVSFSVEHPGDPDSRASTTAHIVVDEVFGLDLTITPPAEYVPAGRELVLLVNLLNRGNTTATIELEADGSHNATVRLDRTKISLQPQESTTIQARVPTNSRLDHKIVQQAHFRAAVKENPETHKTATTQINVIPLYSRVKPRAAPIPVYLSLQTVGDEQGASAQMSISGSMDALGGTVSVNVNLAEHGRAPMFGSRDSYQVRFESEKMTVKLGDHVQEISPLTTKGHYGTGVSAQGLAGRIEYKGIAQRTRHVFPTQSLLGASIGYRLTETVRISSNLLHRKGLYNGTITTARGIFTPFGQQHTLDVECGIDSGAGFSDPSCLVDLAGTSDKIGYQGRILRTSDSYPGSTNHLTENFGHLSYRFPWGLRMDGSYRDQKRGFSDGYGRTSSFIRIGAGISQRFGAASTFIDAHYLRQRLSHESLDFAVDRSEEVLRIRSGIQMRSMGLRGSVDLGHAESAAYGYRGSVLRTRVTARLSPTSHLSLSASGDYAKGYLINTATEMSRWLVSLQANIRIGKSTRIIATVYRNATTILEEQLYTSFQTHLQHTFRSGHRLLIRAQHSRLEGSRASGATDYKVAYTLPIGIPLRRGESANRYISGRVYDAESNEGLDGVLLFLGDGVTITEANGHFKIPRPRSGSDYLRIDQKSIGFERVPILQMPLKIESDDLNLSMIEIPVVRAATLAGSIALYGSEAGVQMVGMDSLKMEKISAVRDVVLELSTGSTRFRSRSDRSGQYRFTGIPPGNYNLRIVTAPLPDNNRFQPAEGIIRLKAGDHQTFDFSIRPVVRKIIMLDSSDLSVSAGDGEDIPEMTADGNREADPIARTNKAVADEIGQELSPSSQEAAAGVNEVTGDRQELTDGVREQVRAPKRKRRWFDLLRESGTRSRADTAREGSVSDSTGPASKSAVPSPDSTESIDNEKRESSVPGPIGYRKERPVDPLLILFVMNVIVILLFLSIRFGYQRRLRHISVDDPFRLRIYRYDDRQNRNSDRAA